MESRTCMAGREERPTLTCQWPCSLSAIEGPGRRTARTRRQLVLGASQRRPSRCAKPTRSLNGVQDHSLKRIELLNVRLTCLSGAAAPTSLVTLSVSFRVKVALHPSCDPSQVSLSLRPRCVSASVISGLQGRAGRGRSGLILLGLSHWQPAQGPSASRMPSLRSGQVRSGRAMPLSG